MGGFSNIGTVESRQYFAGLSTHTKPTSLSNNGDRLFEIDTMLLYRWDKENERWVPQPQNDVQRAFAISPSDEENLAHITTAIYIGSEGNIKIDLVSEETVTFVGLLAGVFYPIRAIKVYDTDTTAENIVGVY